MEEGRGSRAGCLEENHEFKEHRVQLLERTARKRHSCHLLIFILLPCESSFVRTFQDHPQVSEGQLLLCEGLEEVVILEVPLLAVPIGPDLHDVDHGVVTPLAQGAAGRRAGNEITMLEGSCCQSKFLVTFLSAHH